MSDFYEKDGFLAELDSHMIYVYNIALKILGPVDAEDAAQEAILKAYKNRHGFRGDSKLSTWLYTITMNVCRDMLRKKNKRQEREVPVDDVAALSGGPEPERALEEDAEKEEAKALLSDALASLSDDFREILIMRETLNYSYEEISEALDLPLGTVKSRIKRAREKARDFIAARLISQGRHL